MKYNVTQLGHRSYKYELIPQDSELLGVVPWPKEEYWVESFGTAGLHRRVWLKREEAWDVVKEVRDTAAYVKVYHNGLLVWSTSGSFRY